jgi:hypothetical protein
MIKQSVCFQESKKEKSISAVDADVAQITCGIGQLSACGSR